MIRYVRGTTLRPWSRLVASCLLLALSAPAAKAEFKRERVLLSNQTSKRMVGSASGLQGSVHIVHVFAGDQVSSWTAADRTATLARFRQGCDFLRRQSRRFGKQVTFVEQIAPDVRLSSVIPTDSFANPGWTEDVILAATNQRGRELVESIQAKTAVDHVAICLHVSKPALSYNLAFYDNVAPEYAAERMVCFHQYPDTRPTSAATYAHEVLHLFGAGDLYFPYDDNEQRKTVARRMFPDDIMYRVDYDINRLYVGPFTAYRVGWTDALEPEFRQFED